MADDKESEGGSLTVADALQMYEDYKSYWSENYREAEIDLKMAAGDRATHWGDGWDSNFKGVPLDSPSLVINELPQYIHQVTNDIRQNVPSIKALPVADADIETGKIFSGLFRAIEDHSHADEVTDTAAEYAVTCSIGFMRIDHDYCNDESDEQEILFKSVADPLSTWLDPASIEFDGRDANGAISLEPIDKKTFNRLYPKKKFSSFVDPKDQEVNKKNSIIIAEIFVREFSGKRGKKATIRRYKFSGEDLLAETTFPGDFIPIVPIYGQVSWINGKRYLSSLIRQARDPQRRLNHWAGKEAEILKMAPIAPVMAEEGTLVNERGQWQSPGKEMVLEYRSTGLDGNPANVPSRLQPPPIPTGIINAMQGAKENIKESMGIYNAGLGKREGDASGVALEQLDRTGDVATFHYPDNVRRSYGHMGEIALCMMPIIYDTPRIIQTLNDETDVVMIGINGAPRQEGQKQDYDLTKGKYRVRITTGASYTTKRQEESAFLSTIFQKAPQLMQIGGDILFRSMDTPGAQSLAERVKKTIPPQLLADSEQPQIPPQVNDPIEIAKLEIEKEEKQREYQLKERELAIKEFDAETKRMQAMQKQPDTSQGIKLDTTGFQFSKTPEQEAMEVEQAQMLADRQAQEDAEEALKQQQAQALIGTLGTIDQTLKQLTTQVAQPKIVIRDANGMIQGVQ